MNENFYFDGRQIKNYLVGFASLFAEIPYKNRKGKIETVPIHYGSPSDVISHLENNVDNEATKNRNRLKDISVPMFSFRMTSIERNVEKRRAPHDTMTVDLRPLGYNVGYVTMKPSPYRFTMELVCWASSDYQAFEISEQIIPYFNSPQQVIIEPLPRSPVSTTEIFLESIEIDTEPESQKYSAMITMSFSLTGFLLTQPRLWSTNLQFEFSMLDEKGGLTNIDDTDYSVGHEIRDLNTEPKRVLPKEDRFAGLDSFILNTPELLEKYGDKLAWFNILKDHGRIDDHGVVIDSTELTVDYKDLPKTFYPETIQLVAEDMDDVNYVFSNEKLQEYMKSQSLEGNLKVLDDLFNDSTDTIDVYLTLLDNNLATKGFNSTDVNLTNSEKFALLGSTRIDTDDVMGRMRNYLAGLENLKMRKDQLETRDLSLKPVFKFKNIIPYDNLPSELQDILEPTYLVDNESLPKLDLEFDVDLDDNLIITTIPEITGKIIMESEEGIKVVDFTTDTMNNTVTIPPEEYTTNKSIGVTVVVDNRETIVNGIVVRDLEGLVYGSNPDGSNPDGSNPDGSNPDGSNPDGSNPDGSNPDGIEFDFTNFDFTVYGLEDLYNIGINSDEIVDFELDENFYKLFNFDGLLDEKFLDLDEYIVSTLGYNKIQIEPTSSEKILKILKQKFGLAYDTVIEKAGKLKQLTMILEKYIDITQGNKSVISDEEFKNGFQKVSEDLVQAIHTDKMGKPIYDVNRDGYINKEDLELIDAVVDNPDDYDYKLNHGVWHKNFNIEEMSEERISKFMSDLKVLLYLLEKDNFDEINDYLTLFANDLVVGSFDFYEDDSKENIKKNKEIKALGYNISELDDKFLFMRLFVDSMKNILVKEKDYLVYRLPEINDDAAKLLYSDEGVDIDKIVVGKYVSLYLNTFTGNDRLDREYEIRQSLKSPLGNYLDYIYDFGLLIKDIDNAGLFKECLTSNTMWLDDNLPDIKVKIEEKYK